MYESNTGQAMQDVEVFAFFHKELPHHERIN